MTEIAHVLAWTYDRLDLVASFVSLDVLISIRRFETARALLDDLDRELAGRDEQLEAKTLWLRSMLEVEAGRWSLAQDLAKREREIAWWCTRPTTGPARFKFWPSSQSIAAVPHRARQLVCQGRELVAGRRNLLPPLEATLGVADFAGGDPGAAIAHLTAEEAAAGGGTSSREPSQVSRRLDLGRGIAGARPGGRGAGAPRRLGAGRTSARPRLDPRDTRRCRRPCPAARGDKDLALSTLEQAVEQAWAAPRTCSAARAHS